MTMPDTERLVQLVDDFANTHYEAVRCGDAASYNEIIEDSNAKRAAIIDYGAALLRERDAANAKFARHIAAVEEYLVGLFAVIVDPVDDPPTDVEQTMARLLAVATKTRDDLNDLRAKRTADDASIPAAALAPVAISALKERDDLRARLAAAEQDMLQLIDGRDGCYSQIERIYHALGGTGEWSSACDLGDEAIELAENSDIAELRSRCAAAEQENAALKDELARAAVDLGRYGHHTAQCGFNRRYNPTEKRGPCTCGYRLAYDRATDQAIARQTPIPATADPQEKK